MITTLPIFSNSVRLFFPLAAIIAIFVPMYTVTVIVNDYTLPPSQLSFYQWHGFQMLFVFFYTLVVGFILTAGANWTKTEPIKGSRLILLVLLWLNEQYAISFADNKAYLIASCVVFSITALFFITRTLSTYSKRYHILGIFTLYSVLKIAYLFGALHRGFTYKELLYDLTVWLLVVLSSLISKRVIPVFTKNFFELTEDLKTPKYLNMLSSISLYSLVFTNFINSNLINSSLFLIAGLSGLAHLFYWNTLQSLKKPIIGMLHVGYFVLYFSLITKSASFFVESLNYTRANLHLSLTGGLSILALNIMVRASLGHSGRKILMNKSIGLMFISIILGMSLRYIVPIVKPEYFEKSLHHSMGFWTLAFAIYLVKFLPILLRKRINE